MRQRFYSLTLRQRFQSSWQCLPLDVQQDLRRFIRQVREVKRLDGTRIGCPDGTRFGPLSDGAGYTFFYKDDSTSFCDVILPSLLNHAAESQTVCIILHELAHVFEYFNIQEKSLDIADVESEYHAWDTASLWVANGMFEPELIAEVKLMTARERLQIRLQQLVREPNIGHSPNND